MSAAPVQWPFGDRRIRTAGAAVPVGFAILHILFAVNLEYDIWDGVILDYWLRTKDFRGIDVWFREAAGPITWSLLRSMQATGDLLPVLSSIRAFSVVAIVAYLWGMLLMFRALGVEASERLLAGLFLLVSPVFLLYASSMNALVMTYCAFSFMGLALLERGRWGHLVGLVLLLLSCQLWSNVTTIAVFLAFRTLAVRGVKWELASAAVVVSATLYLLLFRLEPTGEYVGYNALANLSLTRLAVDLYASSFTRTFLPVYGLYVALVGATGLLTRRFVGRDWMRILWLAAFYFGGSLPYIVVGKQPPALDIFPAILGGGQFVVADNFDYRHLLQVYCWICLAAAGCVWQLHAIVAHLLPRARGIAPAAAVVFGLAMMSGSALNLLRSTEHLRQRDRETLRLVEVVRQECDGNTWPCEIDLSAAPDFLADAPRFYELNYLYFRASGRPGMVVGHTQPQADSDFALRYSCASPAHAAKYLFDFSLCPVAKDPPLE